VTLFLIQDTLQIDLNTCILRLHERDILFLTSSETMGSDKSEKDMGRTSWLFASYSLGGRKGAYIHPKTTLTHPKGDVGPSEQNLRRFPSNRRKYG